MSDLLALLKLPIDPSTGRVAPLVLIFRIWTIGVSLLAAAYYLMWFIGLCRKGWPKLWQWIKFLLTSRFEANQMSRKAISMRLGSAMLDTAGQVLKLLRLAIVVAVILRFWRFSQPSLFSEASVLIAPAGMTTPAVFLHVLFIYLAFIFKAGKAAKEAQTSLEIEARRGREGMWPQNLPDVFFLPAIIDVLFLLYVGLALPSSVNEIHLAFAVPFAASWLFRAEGRIFMLCLLTCATITVHWVCATIVFSGALANAPMAEWTDAWRSLLSTIIPRVAFWSLVCGLMMIMRVLRRKAEAHAAVFTTLAENLPFDVFVKDYEHRFVYANERLIRNLRCLPGNEELSLVSLQGKTDRDLGVEPQKAKLYEASDRAALNGQQKLVQLYEPSYELDSKELIETTKVGIRNRDQTPSHLLGICRSQMTDTDSWFWVAVVGQHRRHCFFHKKSNRFVWVNEKFAEDAGKASASAIVGLTDTDLYNPQHARAYQTDDLTVMQGERLEREEWHQPTGRPKRRVYVVKVASKDREGESDGVRGFFYEIHGAYLRFLSAERLLVRYLEAALELGALEATSDEDRRRLREGVSICHRALRLLNLGDHELACLAAGDLSDVPKSCGGMVWTSRMGSAGDCVESVVAFMRLLHPGIDITTDVGQETDGARFDSEWFQVGALALLMYALARVERHGAEEHSCQTPRRLRVKIGCELAGPNQAPQSHLDVSVCDGITHGTPPQIEALREEVDDQLPGMVCGLVVAQRLATLCGGYLRGESNHDGSPGATFRFGCPNR
jgi:hypothetical protein